MAQGVEFLRSANNKVWSKIFFFVYILSILEINNWLYRIKKYLTQSSINEFVSCYFKVVDKNTMSWGSNIYWHMLPTSFIHMSGLNSFSKILASAQYLIQPFIIESQNYSYMPLWSSWPQKFIQVPLVTINEMIYIFGKAMFFSVYTWKLQYTLNIYVVLFCVEYAIKGGW